MKAAFPHFILTEGRSGSNYLVSVLNRHPQIINYGEVLGHWTVPHKVYRLVRPLHVSWEGYLDWLYSSNNAIRLAQAYSWFTRVRQLSRPSIKGLGQIRTVGIKDFSFLLKDRDLVDYFTSRTIKTIFLYRRNLLKRYLSLLRLQVTGEVRAVNREVKHCKLCVDTGDLMEKMDVFAKERELSEAIVERMDSNNVLKVAYEDLFQDRQTTQRMILDVFEFLGVEPMLLESNHRKLGLNQLDEYIENYSEVEKVLKGTPYEKFLYH